MLLRGGAYVGQVRRTHRRRRRWGELIVQLWSSGRGKWHLELSVCRCLLGHCRWQLNHVTAAKLLRSLQRGCAACCCKGLILPVPIHHVLLHARLRLLVLLLHRHHHGCSIRNRCLGHPVPHQRRCRRHHGTSTWCHGAVCKACHCVMHAVRMLVHPAPLRSRTEQWSPMHGGPGRKSHDCCFCPLLGLVLALTLVVLVVTEFAVVAIHAAATGEKTTSPARA